jgi:hypothetical protein
MMTQLRQRMLRTCRTVRCEYQRAGGLRPRPRLRSGRWAAVESAVAPRLTIPTLITAPTKPCATSSNAAVGGDYGQRSRTIRIAVKRVAL